MRDFLRHTRPTGLAMVLVLSFGLVLSGCSDDDDDSPTAPTDTEFNEAFAAQQAQSVVPLVVDLVDNLSIYALNPPNKAADDYYEWVYNAMNGRWEGAAEMSYEGMTISYLGWLQYLDGDGNAVQMAGDAASYSFHNELEMVGAYSDESVSWTLEMQTEEDYAVDGLNTEVLQVVADASANIDYSSTSGGNTSSATYSYSYRTLGEGIAFPVDGCPTGQIEFTFAPYRVVVTFDGTATASYAMYDGNGNSIPAGSGSEPLDCAK
jgi:hypothetical protein